MSNLFQPGQRVSFKPISLWGQKGTIISYSGSWAFVKWDRTNFGPIKEWKQNLRLWERVEKHHRQ